MGSDGWVCGGGRGTSLWLRVAGGHPEVTLRWTTSAPVSNEMYTEAGERGRWEQGAWPGSPEATAASCHCRYNFFISKDDKSFGPDSHSRAYTAESFLIPSYCSDKAGLIPSQYIFYVI